MPRKKISQVEAWNLYHKVSRLEDELNRQRISWSANWPSGTLLCSRTYSDDERLTTAIGTARLLDHAVVVTSRNANELIFYALPLPKSE
jgi:hypothetical protein